MHLLRLPDLLEHAAAERDRDYLLIEVDHHNATISRLHCELGLLGHEVIDGILDTNMAILTFEKGEGEALFDQLDYDFPEQTTLSIKVSLFRPFKPVAAFEQLQGCPRTFSLPPV